jgi:hypothetical protein
MTSLLGFEEKTNRISCHINLLIRLLYRNLLYICNKQDPFLEPILESIRYKIAQDPRRRSNRKHYQRPILRRAKVPRFRKAT